LEAYYDVTIRLLICCCYFCVLFGHCHPIKCGSRNIRDNLGAIDKEKKTAFFVMSIFMSVKLVSRLLLRYGIMSLCGTVTLYIFASSYSTTFNRALPMVDAVGTVNIRPLDRFLQNYAPGLQPNVGNYGKPQYMKLPAQNVRMLLAPALKDNNQFVARANAGHYALTSQPKNGNFGDALIYYRKSWRTNDRPESAKIGDNIFIDTDRGWRYFYRIDEVKTTALSSDYVARGAQSNQLLVAAVDSQSNGNITIAHAALVNVQNVQQ
jgi:hypothetical protein